MPYSAGGLGHALQPARAPCAAWVCDLLGHVRPCRWPRPVRRSRAVALAFARAPSGSWPAARAAATSRCRSESAAWVWRSDLARQAQHLQPVGEDRLMTLSRRGTRSMVSRISCFSAGAIVEIGRRRCRPGRPGRLIAGDGLRAAPAGAWGMRSRISSACVAQVDEPRLDLRRRRRSARARADRARPG